jgi:hypothetical protein
VAIADISAAYEEITGKVAVVKQHGLWKLSSPYHLPSFFCEFTKRIFDVFLS